MRSKFAWATFVAAGVCASAASAQPQTLPLPDGDKLFVLQNTPLPVFGGQIDIIRSEGGVLGPVVKGKPYSARTVTESTQTLADGNRITQRNEAVIYRDSDGRSRREQTLTGVGPWQAGEPVTMINIHDPVAGKTYVLDPMGKTAREIRQFQMAIAHDEAGLHSTTIAGGGVFTAAVPAPPPLPGPGAGNVTVIERRDDAGSVQVFAQRAVGVAALPPGTGGADEPGEDLGEQVLEGLLVKGTRMTDTIPAGTIGNDRPIDIVTERWYSEDIDAMVLQRFSDPRFGETTYKLVNIARGEPSPDLFQVPQGYEIKAAEMPRAGIRVTPPGVGAGEAVHFDLRRAEPARAQSD
jgi:hypothetical protein